ncbi:MAG: hypothetical protein HOL85_17555 [Rhodospirillaceae bacterium]|nr:hypothetical protein [Rhodospirillaceae bacterium]
MFSVLGTDLFRLVAGDTLGVGWSCKGLMTLKTVVGEFSVPGNDGTGTER